MNEHDQAKLIPAWICLVVNIVIMSVIFELIRSKSRLVKDKLKVLGLLLITTLGIIMNVSDTLLLWKIKKYWEVPLMSFQMLVFQIMICLRLVKIRKSRILPERLILFLLIIESAATICNCYFLLDISRFKISIYIYIVNLLCILFIDLLQLWFSYQICKNSANPNTSKKIFNEFLKIFILQQLINLVVIGVTLGLLNLKSDEASYDKITAPICVLLYLFDYNSGKIIEKILFTKRLCDSLFGSRKTVCVKDEFDVSSQLIADEVFLEFPRSRIK
jgi:hypothetical protein